MKTETKEKIENILNIDFKYLGKKIKIQNFKEVNGLIVVFTDNGTFNFRESEIDNFISDLEIIETKKTGRPIKLPQKVDTIQKNETHLKLESSLSQMLDKVMDDKEFISQASAVCNIANTMINLEKQHLNLIRETKRN